MKKIYNIEFCFWYEILLNDMEDAKTAIDKNSTKQEVEVFRCGV